MITVTQQGRFVRIMLVVSLLVLSSMCFLGQPESALAQSPWTSVALANALEAMRAQHQKPQTDAKGQNKSGGTDSSEIQIAGQGTQNQIAKWTDNAGTLDNSVITELSGNTALGTPRPTTHAAFG